MQFSLGCLGSLPLPRLLRPFPLTGSFAPLGSYTRCRGLPAAGRSRSPGCGCLPGAANALTCYAFKRHRKCLLFLCVASATDDRQMDGRTDWGSDEPTDGRRHWRVLERHCRQPPCVMHSLWSVKFACFSGIKIQNQSQNFPYAFPLLLLWSP